MSHLGEDFKVGDNVAVLWQNQDKSSHGGTEGVVLGIVGDEISGKFLIIDRSSYQDSFKNMLPFLNILDLRVIPIGDLIGFTKLNVRKRPPGILENSNLIMEVDYKSNIDFNDTIAEIEKREDCKHKRKYKHKRVGNSNSETYQFFISEIQSIEKASLHISCKGTIQIFCRHPDLDSVINWLKDHAKMLPDQNCLVLIPTKVTYQIHATFKDPAKPNAELIKRLGKVNRSAPLILPIGWISEFFNEMDKNPLKGLFPNESNINDIALEETKPKKKHSSLPSDKGNYIIPEQLLDPRYLTTGININKYLGAGAPIMRLKGLVSSYEIEKELMKNWMNGRLALWNWFTSIDFEGKIVMRDLTFDKKTSTYLIDFRKYYGTDFFPTKSKDRQNGS